MSMTITIKYFGLVAEMTGRNEETVNLEGEEYDLEALKELCYSKYELSDTESIQVAVNQSTGISGPLKHGDEVAFLPPYAGG